ncbi:NAD-P-binding protein [Peniophora sp. CONT]|nr:NAD-P-binding protein [Peniophora sp. CONT]
MSIKGITETLPVETRHEVYPTIDPASGWASQSFKGKAVFITGASRGIGRVTAVTFAKAGAAVAIAARSESALEETKAAVLKEVPEAKVEKYVVDVKNTAQVEAAVEAAAAAFGRLDVVIANAGALTVFGKTMDEKPADAWWNTFEVNILGVYNTIRPAAKYLRKVNGCFVATSSLAAQLRWPGGSDYETSKHTVNRLIEFVDQESPSVTAFALHPGSVATDIAHESGLVEQGVEMPDAAELPAYTMFYLASGKADWLSGRYVDATWDLGQVEREWKEKILAKDLLINKLDVVG